MDDAERDRGVDGSLMQLQLEMDQYIAHQRLRLRLIAVVLAAMAALVAIGHALEDAGATIMSSSGLDEMIAGYPVAIAVGLCAAGAWGRARIYRALSQPSHVPDT